jgi:HAD superfamily hydrolase (TIGR01459 family)
MLIEKPPIPIIESAASLIGGYDAWLCDIWGVIHNGVKPFPSAVEACRSYRRGGGTIVFITNAPRPSAFVREQLGALGVPGDAYDDIATSGDVTLDLLARREGQAMFHLGPDRDKPMLDGLDLRRVGPDEAEFILNSGPFDDDRETPENYRALFERLAARRVPMLCANPDLMVERGGRLIYCAGALAQLYAALGGSVDYAGKPYAPIYDLAFARLQAARGGLRPARALGIGDGVKTDVKGAADYGLDALYIASAVHLGEGGALTSEGVAALFAEADYRPIAAQSVLRW